ncbi:MAG TPA: LacI family DNA-binding transcriptional regulator [Acetobacteraceae bacterium]|nr:LacI family DNA-binding transcriptional regulator [Acetobacteraceae bacterium]
MAGKRGSMPGAKLADVAAAAGVAPMTVSRVINTPERVAAATAERVRAAIARLGYVPNLVAGGLSSRRSRMIAAIVPTIAHPMFADLMGSFTETLRTAGYQVMLSLSGYGHGREDELVPALLGRRPDGILLTGIHHDPAARVMLVEAGIPVVEIFDTAPRPIDMLIGFDHAEVGAAVAGFFLARGHDRFAVFAAGDARAQARRRGFMEQVIRDGGRMIAHPTLPAPSTIMAGREALRHLVPTLSDRVALFCSSDLLAFGAIVEARQHGIAVPGQLAVCGFGDFELGAASEPAFTTVTVEAGKIGREAAMMLLRRLNGTPGPALLRVPFRILERRST